MAAQQLLELSAGRTWDLRASGEKEGGKEGWKRPPPLINGFVGSHYLKNNKLGCGLVNGDSEVNVSGAVLCEVDEEGDGVGVAMDTCEEQSKGGKVAMDTCEEQSKGDKDTMVNSFQGGSGESRCELENTSSVSGPSEHTMEQNEEEMELRENMIDTNMFGTYVHVMVATEHYMISMTAIQAKKVGSWDSIRPPSFLCLISD